LADVALRLGVRLGRSRADDVEPQLLRDPLQLRCGHPHSVPPMKAIRIFEDVPDPEPAAGEVLVELRAASVNHLDVWVRMGLPSVPKPRILGADGAGVVEALGEGVDGLYVGQRVVLNPGIPHGQRITVIGEHTDGTCCELKAIPASQLYPLDDTLSFVEGAAFPLTFETAYRMLVTKASVQDGEWVLIWGIGGGV